VFKKFEDAILVVSYRSPGFPSRTFLKELLEQYKEEVQLFTIPRKYALSKFDENFELLFVGK